jgi:ADP-ribose pyrophosphatase YjhB (NUDIX family)
MVAIHRPSDGAMLVQTEPDRVERPFDRPLGGHVEFGELAAETVRRRLREEIGEETDQVELLGIVENLFELDGSPGHEVVFLFTAAFADPVAYDVEERPIRDDTTGRVVVRRRKPNDSCRRLFPDQVAALLDR